MARFDGVDFFNIDAQLSEEERMVRDLVRVWVDDNVIPVIEQHCRAGTFPADLVPQMAEMGLLGVNLHGYAWKQDGCVAARVHGIILLSPGRFVGPVPAINPALERVVDAAALSE